MNDLMNKIGALIEEHVKAEVASRRVLDESECETRLVALFGVTDPRDIVESVERAVKERDKHKDNHATAGRIIEHVRLILGASSTELLHEAAQRVRNEYNTASHAAAKYRTMWEQLHLAHTEHLDAKEQLKELLGALGLSHFTSDRSVIAGARASMRERDARLCSERDEAWAARDTAEKRYQEASDKAHELELKLLEVRKVVADEARAPVEVDGFRVGDLVRWNNATTHVQSAYSRGHGHRGLVIVGGETVQAIGLVRKPVEMGDSVRFDGSPPKIKWVVRSMKENKNGELVCWFDGERFALQSECIAVAP